MLRLEALTLVQDDFCLSADFSIAAGARVAVIGPSGAGKSSLLSAIAGFYAPASGRILWEGRDIGGLAPGARPLSMLFQDGNLFPHLTVTENLGLGISPDLRLTATDRESIAEALARVGLAGFGPRRPAQLSGGEQSRVALARVLLRARPLLLLDEPFAALGPALKEQMLDLVAELCAATGIDRRCAAIQKLRWQRRISRTPASVTVSISSSGGSGSEVRAEPGCHLRCSK